MKCGDMLCYSSHCRSSGPEVFLGKGVLKICSEFTGEHPCRRVICNFNEIALQHGCSPVNLLHTFRMPFPNNTSEWLLLPLSVNSEDLGTFKSKNLVTSKDSMFYILIKTRKKIDKPCAKCKTIPEKHMISDKSMNLARC